MNATRTKVLAAAAALLAVPALSACGTNFDAQTDQIYTPADGENSYDGGVAVLNALIVSETPGSGRFIAGLVNRDSSEADTLEGVEGIGDSAEVTFSIEGDTEIPPGGSVQLADEDAAMVTASGGEDVLAPGRFVRVTVSFANGDSAELNVPVLSSETETYDDVELP